MHRKVVRRAVALMLIFQLLLYGLVFGNYFKFIANNQSSTAERMLQYQNESIVHYFGELEAMLALISSDDWINYAKLYLNMKDSREQREYGEKLSQMAGELNLADSLVEDIFIIGQNENQANFRKTIGQQSWSSDNLPSLDALERIGMLWRIVRNSGKPDILRKEEFLKLAENQGLAGWTPSQIKNATSFIDLTDRKMVISTYRSNVLVLLTLQPDFMQHFVYSEGAQGRFILRNEAGGIIWTSHAAQERGELSGQRSYSTKLIPYEYELQWIPDPASLWSFKSLLLLGIALTGVILMYTKKMSESISASIFVPFRRLASVIQRESNEWPKSPISVRTWSNTLMKLPLRWKLLYLYSVSVILPILLLGIFYSSFFYYMSKSDLTNATKVTAEQLRLYISRQFQSYEQLADYLFISENLRGPQRAWLHPSMSNVNYAVRYNALGVIEPFYVQMVGSQAAAEPQILSTPFNRVLWVPETADEFGRFVPSLARKIVSEETTTGYLVLRLKQGALEPSIAKQVPDILITKKNQIIYRSGAQSDLKKADRSAVKVDLKLNDMKLTITQSTEIVVALNRQLLQRYAIVVAILIAIAFGSVYWLSSRIVRRLEHFDEAMARAGSGEWSTVMLEGNDEVSELSRSYNRMIEQIQQLLEAKIDSEVREERLTALKSKVEIQMLQQQINPHFLYNTLQAISMRAMNGDKLGVNTMVGALADMIRFAVGKGPMEVSVSEEIEHVTNYGIILQARYRDKLVVEWDIAPETKDVPVLKFIMQPIIENAIQHGIAKLSRVGKVHISVYLETGDLLLVVEDNGVGMDEEQLRLLSSSLLQSESSSGIGLSNVARRLDIYYQGKARVTIESALMKGTKVSLRIPVTPAVSMGSHE
ncbi:HAMP domain-containing protein [Paenibacillus sp. LMG 31461]|uniref:histidine kinase n=1 Tax=Paenibacillus plantarum TaxID=2654975 RepID=A0ABX1X328_9BACL|nr:sensor histidine kinase [Paenibacillus plantarum]NOU62498.1 HAMP domain-containing protein [Paenibacillus plantarum]